MKSCLRFLLPALLCVLCRAAAAESEALFFGDFRYTVADGCVTVADYAGSDARVVVPSEIDGMRVTEIGQGAFYCNEGVREIVIPETVVKIGWSAFWGSGDLTTVRIPKSVTEIGDGAFRMTGVAAIDIDPENPAYEVIDGVLFDKAQKALHTYPGMKPGEAYAVPEGVERIGDNAFYGAMELTRVALPEGLTEIGPCAFSGCYALAECALPDSVVSIGYDAFYGCYALERIVLPEGLRSIGSGAFRLSGVLRIVIPASVTEIGEEAFDPFGEIDFLVVAGSDAEKYLIEHKLPYALVGADKK